MTRRHDLDGRALWLQKLRPDLRRRVWECDRCGQTTRTDRSHAVGVYDMTGRIRVAIVCPGCASSIHERSPWDRGTDRSVPGWSAPMVSWTRRPAAVAATDGNGGGS